MRVILSCLFLTSFILNVSCAFANVQYPYPNDTEVKVQKIEINNTFKGDVIILNPGDNAWLAQAWVEDNENNKISSVYPPLTRLEPKGTLRLNILSSKNLLAKQHWFVVLFIPEKKQENKNSMSLPLAYKLKISEKNNIKLEGG